MTHRPLPTAIKTDSRICFGIAYFATEADADAYAQYVHERGDTYNGGFMDGMRCGRDTGYDHADAMLGMCYAVTTR